MEIYIETIRAIGADGRAIDYYATPHWTIDEQDSISPDTMRIVCERVRDTLNECFRAAKIEKGVTGK